MVWGRSGDQQHAEDAAVARLLERVEGLDRLTEAKFVTYRSLIDLQAEKVALALTASDKAITKAEAATERRFELLNEFRAQSADWASRFATREATELANKQIRERMEQLSTDIEKEIDRVSAQTGRLMTGLLLTIVTALIGALTLVLTR
ncbi:MAG TPA: hypothetical protein VFR23_11610 [Jiangellaceae bacterium]|nr:hypothetical protein [Jiangellaceae bacterium]